MEARATPLTRDCSKVGLRSLRTVGRSPIFSTREDSIPNSVTVNVFENEAERAAYLETLHFAKTRVGDIAR